MRISIVIVWLFCGISSFATTYYSQSSGDPSTTTNWDSERNGGGTEPSNFTTGSDVFVIQNGHTLTTTGIWNLGGSNMTLQIENGGVLQANHEIDLTPSSTFQIDNGGTYNHNFTSKEIFDGTESFGSSSTVEFQARPSSTLDQGITFGNLTFDFSSGGSLRIDNTDNETFTVNGDLKIENSGGGTNEIRMATGSGDNITLTIAGSLMMSGGRFDFYSGSGGSNGTINIGGDLLFTGGTWDNAGSDNLTVNFTNTISTSSINLSGVAYSNAQGDVDYNIQNGSTTTLLSDWVIGSGELLTVESGGQLNFSTFNVSGSGGFATNSGASLGIGATDGIDNASTGGNIRFTSANRSIDLGTNIIYNGTSAQETGDGVDDIGVLTGKIQISNVSNTVTFTQDLNVGDGFEFIVDENASLDMNSGIEIIKSSGSATLTINGTVIIGDDDGFSTSGTSDAAFQGFTSCVIGNSALVNYDQSGSQTITNQFSYGSLTLSGSSNKTAAGSLDVNGDILITGSATFIPGSNQVNIAGGFTLSSSGSLTESGSTIVFDGTGTHAISSTRTTENLDDVQFTGTGTYNLGSSFRINSGHSLTITGACTINTGDNEFDSPSGNFIMSTGTFNFETVTATDNLPDFNSLTITGGTIELGGAGNQQLNGGETYNNLTFSGSGTKTISSATSSISGTVYITETCTLNVGSSTLGGGSTNLTMDNGHLIVEGSSTRPTIGGTYSLTGGTIEFAGSSATTVRSPLTYNNVIISGTNIATSSGNYTLNSGATFTVNSGAKFTTSTRRIIGTTSSNVVINGTFKTEDADGFSGTSGSESIDLNTISLTLGSSSTIEYGRSGGQSISDRDDYANLIVSGSGIKTMTGSPSISGNYTLSAGSVNYPTSLTFNGSATQSIAGNNYGTTTIILSGGGEKDIDAETTINGTITFTNGDLDLNNHNLNLGTSVTVSSANSDSYVKIGGTGRVVRTITNGSDFFFPIGENPYLPMTVSCASCTNEEISVGVEDVIYDDPEVETTTFATAGHTNYVNKTWDLNTDGISGNVTIKLQWNSSDQTTNPGSNNSSNSIALGFWENGNSLDWDPGTVSTASVSGTVYTQERTLSGLNSNKYFLGIGASSTPLPVEFAFFSANCQNDDLINFSWKTFTETNCSHFELQLSIDGISFFTEHETFGQGTTLNPTFYQNTIKNELGYQFARLKQVDFDGVNDFSKTVEIDCKNTKALYSISGNNISFSEPISVQILNINGALIENFKQSTRVNLSYLPSGIYLLKTKESVEKITIQ
ncbi:MAG: hypothetical protein JXQ87_07610 [Bacteroidia bacterium]